jgi:Uma2 family endonuclease
MATAPSKTYPRAVLVELENGARMTRAEFHRLYVKTPPKFKAELIGGIVYVASPVSPAHGKNHLNLGVLLGTYALHTPGTEAGDNATVFLSDEGEPQPDLYLRIRPEYGGQSRTTRNDYVAGAPELVAEIANSSKSIDLHEKRIDYARNGVREYLVLCVRERQLRWFDLPGDRELYPDSNGIIRVRCFPGLWIDVVALLEEDPQILTVLNQGLANSEHAAFVSALAAAHVPHGRRERLPARKPGGRRKPNGNSR